jgi:glutaconate CoA-transferase subunit B
MYMTVPRTILFREEHSSRVLVPRCDIISAPGVSPPGVFRRGTAQALVTGRAVFAFDPRSARFTLMSVHDGETAESVREATGFEYDVADSVPTTAPPTEAERALLRSTVCAAMRETYPTFCDRVWGRAPDAAADTVGSAA